jgi:hypothetical protein
LVAIAWTRTTCPDALAALWDFAITLSIVRTVIGGVSIREQDNGNKAVVFGKGAESRNASLLLSFSLYKLHTL